MKLKYALPTILSLSTLSVTPMTLCSCSNDFVKNHANIVNDETFSITFNSTVGHGHTVYDEEGEEIELGSQILVDPSEDFRCTFVSSEYGKGEEPKMPVHRQLKVKDVEVVQDKKNVISKCSLINNVLTIPSTLLQNPSNPIEINLLGAEIADWISWSNIQAISKDDDEHEAAEYSVTNWFEVGDYKMLYEEKESQPFEYATIIDMEKRDYVYVEGTKEKTAPSPFTFETLEPRDQLRWWCDMDEPMWDEETAWEEDRCEIWEKAFKYGEDKRFGFTPRMVDCNSKDKRNNHSYFYMLSLKDLCVEHKKTKHMNYTAPIPESNSKNAFYAYYNVEKYHSVKNFNQRIQRQTTRWLIDHTVREYYKYGGTNFQISPKYPTSYFYGIGSGNGYKTGVSWLFCL